jgi:putative membrane protein
MGTEGAGTSSEETRVKTRSVALALLLAAAGTLGAAAAPGPSHQDRTWLATTRVNDLSEMDNGTSAQKRAATARVRELGKQFQRDHTNLDRSVKAASLRFGVNLPIDPSPDQQRSLAAVEDRDGEAYDAAWVSAEIAQHRKALAAAQVELANGTDPTIVGLARTAEPMLRAHLRALQGAAPARPAKRVNAGTGGQAASDLLPDSSSLALLGFGAVAVAGAAAGLRWRRLSR